MRHVTVVGCLLAVAVVGGTVPGLAAESPNEPPEAEAGLDQYVERGATVLLDAGGSWDPDGEVAAVEWQIRAPNGSVFEPDCATCVETAFVPSRLGTYNVTVTVTDDDGARRSDTLFVTTEPASPPTVDLSATSVGNGTSWRVRADVRAGDHALERLVWRVDGSRIAVEPASGQRATRERVLHFGPNETHDVSVTAADWLGNKGRDSLTLTTDGGTANSPPTIEIVRAPNELAPGESGGFVARASDPDGGTVTIDWSPTGQTGRTAQLSWPTTGTYTVTATATDDEGATASDSVPVTVTSDSGGGNDPGLVVEIVDWPATLEVGENGTFEAVAHTADGSPVPITWGPQARSGDTAVMSWSSPGTKTITATGHFDADHSVSDSVEVDVSPQNGPVADMNIEPTCDPDRSHLCGPVTGTTGSPIEFTAAPSKPGGGDIVAYTWTVDGSLVSNRETFAETFGRGTYNVTLTVEDEFGQTDTTNRTFEVVASDRDVEIHLDGNLSNICSAAPDACSWDPQANALTVTRNATTPFRAAVFGFGEPDPGSIEWTVPSMARGDARMRTGKTQNVTWAALGSGTIEVRYYEGTGSDRTVAAVDTVSVSVVDGANEPPQVTIDDVTQICDADGIRYADGGCSKTAAINVTYTVWDSDATGPVSVDGHLAPEGSHPISNETVSPYEATYTTQSIPVSEDGEHQFRIRVDDGSSVSRATETVFIANATGGGSAGGGGIAVDGKWSMRVELQSGSGIRAETTVECETPDVTSKCPGKTVEVNWGDGSSADTLTSDFEKGSNTWDTSHVYSGDGNPTISVVVLDESGAAITTMQRYLDLGTMDAYINWKFANYVKWNQPNPLSSNDSVQYRDNKSIKDPYVDATWVENTNFSIKNDDWIEVVDTRTNYHWTNQYTYSTFAPYCGDNCKWILVERNARTLRGSKLYTKWYDTKQYGEKYDLVETGQNVIGSATYRVTSKLTGDSWLADECPTGQYQCTLVESGSGTDYKYDVYSVLNQNKYRKKAGDKDWKVQKYWTTVSERWVTVEDVQ